MKAKKIVSMALGLLSSFCLCSTLLAATLSGKIRVDDKFELYLSTSDTSRGVLIASGNQWNTVFNVNATLNDGQEYYLHVFAQDTGGTAGFLGEFSIDGDFHRFSNNRSRIVTNTANWQVSKTGWGSYVAASNAGGVNGNGTPQIGSDANWIWSSDATNDNNVYFSVKINSQAIPYISELRGKIRVDDQSSVFISTDDNEQGTLLGSSSDWQSSYFVNTSLTQGQSYFLHIYGRDLQDIAAVLAEFSLTGDDHVFSNNQKTILSNPTDWRVSTSGWRDYVNASVVNGKNGVSPWGNNPQMSADAYWIWSADAYNHNQVYFSVEIISQSASSTPQLTGYLTGDNAFDVYLSTDDNVEGTYLGTGTDWRTTYNSTRNLVAGQQYYLHIRGRNSEDISGFIGDFTLSGGHHVFPNNQTTISTNTSDWKVSKTGWGNYQKASLVNGNNGVAPWGSRPSISSSASWIWSADPYNDNPVYFSLAISPPREAQSPALAFYQFEESFWSGSGSIIDSSANAHHGSALGSISPVLPTDSQKSCQAMDVPYNSSLFYTNALNTRLDVDRDIGRAGTISFWYRSKASWGASYARQLLDASNGFLFFFGKAFYLTLYSGKLEFGMEDSADRDAILRASGLNYAANQWVHVAITWDLSADSMAIYVNGVAVATTTNAGLNGTMPDLNTLYVGDSRDLYFIGYSSDNSAYGQFDDVRIYQLAQNAAEVAADANTLSPCQTTTVDHFRLEHDTQGFTCESERIVLKACKDSNCTQLYELPTSISLAPGSWNGANTLNFTGSMVANLSITTAGTYTLNKTAASENAGLRCFFGSTETCNIEFVDAGLEFIGATVNDKILPDQLAETPFSQVHLRSVQDNNGVCQAALTGNQNITLAYNCDSPDVCITPFAGIPISNPAGENNGNIAVNFGADGIGSLAALSYADAGRLILSAQATVNGVTLLKGSSLVDVYPAALRLEADPASLLYAGAGDADQYIAGQPFTLSIAAVGAAGGLLANYQAQQLQLKVKRLYPLAAGSVDGNLRYAVAGELGSSLDADLFFDVSNLSFSGGRYQYSSAFYDEVGRIAIDVQDANYLGNNIGSISQLTLGHFIPAYYTVTAESPSPALQNVQNNFTYVGQTIPFYSFATMKITAKNALDQITFNHDSADWLLRPTLSDVNSALKLSYVDKSAYPGVATVFKGNAPIITGDDNFDGSVFITVPDASIVYGKTDAQYNRIAEIDPFTALLDIVFHAGFFTDATGLCFRDNYQDADCNEFVFADVSGADLRFGRFSLKSSYGPEDQPLRPEFSAEYYFQGKWLTNTLDDGATATAIDFSQNANQLLVVKKGDGNDITGLIDPVFSNGRLLQGVPDQQQDFQLSAPGVKGEVFLRLNPQADPTGWPLYLNYDWNGDGKICNQAATCGSGYEIDYPQAVLSFGLFRGNDRVIQWREVFN